MDAMEFKLITTKFHMNSFMLFVVQIGFVSAKTLSMLLIRNIATVTMEPV